MKKTRIANKFRFYSFLAIVVIVVSTLAIYTMNTIAAKTESRYPDLDGYRVVEIGRGDTLWNIALENKPEGLDVREMVHIIEKFNNLDSSFLYEGSTIKIPLK